MKILLLLLLISGLYYPAEFAVAADNETSISYRSAPDSTVWISGSVGPEFGLGWGLTAGGGLGFHGGASVRIQPGQFGAIIDFHNDSSMYFFDPAAIHTFVIGAGVTYLSPVITKTRFFKGSHGVARALIDYGEMDYSVTGRNTLDGRAFGMGATLGADFYVPIYFGFWAHAGPSFDVINYRFKTPPDSRVYSNGNYSESFLVRIGLDYAF